MNIRKLLSIGLSCLALMLLTTVTLADKPDTGRYLIIHADDAGMCHSENMGTINGMEKGIVSSTSIMVPCPWFKEFAEYAKQHPDGDYGVHLTLTCEWHNYRWTPVAPADRVPSLIDDEGYMWPGTRDVAEHVKLEEASIELHAQIDRAKKFGVPLSHLDTHMGSVISRPDLLELYVKLGVEYNLPVLFSRDVSGRLAKEYPALAETGKKMLQLLDKNKMPILDQIAQFYGKEAGTTRREQYLNVLRNLKPGVSQLIIHCGYDDGELRAISNSAARRDEDRRIFTDPEVIELVKKERIKVIGWKEFRKLNAANHVR